MYRYASLHCHNELFVGIQGGPKVFARERKGRKKKGINVSLKYRLAEGVIQVVIDIRIIIVNLTR